MIPDLLAALQSAQREIAEKDARIEELEKLVYVPGVWKCAKCGLVLISTSINADTGQFKANVQPQQCANGCGPMWRRTEREAGNELCDRLDALERQVREQAEDRAEGALHIQRLMSEDDDPEMSVLKAIQWADKGGVKP